MDDADAIPDHRDVIKGELAVHGYWVVASISTNTFWPATAQKVRWYGVDIWVMPIMKDFYPAVAIKVPDGKSRAECEVLVMRFVSMLSWVEERGYTIEGGGLSGGNLPRPLGRHKERGYMICEEFDLSYLPEITDQKAMLALGLMREGRSLNNVGYAFLSFYKVLEVALSGNKNRILSWIAESVASIDPFSVNEALGTIRALDSIRAQGIATSAEIAKHLYESSRCAIAHGAHEPIVDPDNPDDLRRLDSELPIVRALASKAIQEVFGVDTRTTNVRKHLYELQGFKTILGPDIVKHMQNGTAPAEPILQIPNISVRIRRRENYAPLEALLCKHVSYEDNLVHMHFESLEGDIAFKFSLDFGNERIEFDLFSDITVRDTGTAESAERIHEVTRFRQDYFCNGQLHILNADTGELISRKDAYVPLNMRFDGKLAKAELANWKAPAEERRERDRRY
jgi:hypothetical protein